MEMATQTSFRAEHRHDLRVDLIRLDRREPHPVRPPQPQEVLHQSRKEGPLAEILAVAALGELLQRRGQLPSAAATPAPAAPDIVLTTPWHHYDGWRIGGSV